MKNLKSFTIVALSIMLIQGVITYFTGDPGITGMALAAAGDFSASSFTAVKTKLAKIWKEPSTYNHLKRDCPIFNGLYTNQTLDLDSNEATFVINGERCQGFTMVWLQACDLDVEDCVAAVPAAAACDLDGNEIASNSMFYEENICFKKKFKVIDRKCKDMHDKESKIAMGLAQLIAGMDQELEKRTIAFLINSADTLTSIAGDLPLGALNGTDIWEIDKSNFNEELIIDFMELLERLDMGSAKLVTGKIFYKEKKKKEAREGSGCCHYDKLYDAFETYSNLREVDKLAGAPTAFLVDPNAVGYWNSNRYQNTSPANTKDQFNTHVYHLTSNKLRWRQGPGKAPKPVKYDVKWQRKCTGDDEWSEVFEVRHRGAMVLGPENCREMHGIIQVQQVCPGC